MMTIGMKVSTIINFLHKLRGQEIAVTIGLDVWTGRILEFDHHHLVLKDGEGISLLSIEKIVAIDWAPKLEIVAP